MSGLGLTFLRRGGQAHPTAGGDYIKFKDEAVFNILMSKGVSSDGVGITKEDAEAVTSIDSSFFKNNTIVETFDELRYFTNAVVKTSAFNNCTSLKSIDISSQEGCASATFLNCTSLESIRGIENLRTIDTHGFQNSGIKGELHLNFVTKINLFAFANCTNLTKLFLDKVEVIDGRLDPHYNNGQTYYGTFGGCENVTEIYLPSIKTIGVYAFWHNYSLKKIHIGSLCSLIETAVFQGCNIEDFVIESINPPTTRNNTFVGCTIKNLYVPDESVNAYKSAAYWSGFASGIKPISEYQG